MMNNDDLPFEGPPKELMMRIAKFHSRYSDHIFSAIQNFAEEKLKIEFTEESRENFLKLNSAMTANTCSAALVQGLDEFSLILTFNTIEKNNRFALDPKYFFNTLSTEIVLHTEFPDACINILEKVQKKKDTEIYLKYLAYQLKSDFSLVENKIKNGAYFLVFSEGKLQAGLAAKHKDNTNQTIIDISKSVLGNSSN